MVWLWRVWRAGCCTAAAAGDDDESAAHRLEPQRGRQRQWTVSSVSVQWCMDRALLNSRLVSQGSDGRSNAAAARARAAAAAASREVATLAATSKQHARLFCLRRLVCAHWQLAAAHAGAGPTQFTATRPLPYSVPTGCSRLSRPSPVAGHATGLCSLALRLHLLVCAVSAFYTATHPPLPTPAPPSLLSLPYCGFCFSFPPSSRAVVPWTREPPRQSRSTSAARKSFGTRNARVPVPALGLSLPVCPPAVHCPHCSKVSVRWSASTRRLFFLCLPHLFLPTLNLRRPLLFVDRRASRRPPSSSPSSVPRRHHLVSCPTACTSNGFLRRVDKVRSISVLSLEEEGVRGGQKGQPRKEGGWDWAVVDGTFASWAPASAACVPSSARPGHSRRFPGTRIHWAHASAVFTQQRDRHWGCSSEGFFTWTREGNVQRAFPLIRIVSPIPGAIITAPLPFLSLTTLATHASLLVNIDITFDIACISPPTKELPIITVSYTISSSALRYHTLSNEDVVLHSCGTPALNWPMPPGN